MDDMIRIKSCPHCRVGLSLKAAGYEKKSLHTGPDGSWALGKAICPACDGLILLLINSHRAYGSVGTESSPPPVVKVRMVHPKSFQYQCPPNVPKEIAEDVIEASLVLQDSPKASAALSRRCLQNILREVAGVRPGNLASEIDEVLSSGKLPEYLCQQIDAIRNIGNFAAHPIKSERTGEIASVEPDEAQWSLHIVASLINYYFVVLADHQMKMAALNEKLAEAGKPSMKSVDPES